MRGSGRGPIQAHVGNGACPTLLPGLPEQGLAHHAQLWHDRPGEAFPTSAEGVGEELARDRLADEEPTGTQHPGDLGQGTPGARDVVARAEIDDQVEFVILEREVTDVTKAKLHSRSTRPKSGLGLPQKDRVNVEPDQSPGLEPVSDDREGDPLATTNLKGLRASR